MNSLADIIVAVIIAAVISTIVIYLTRKKKKGATCIGCPYSEQCGKCSNK